jgi:hypothetical protein
MRAQTGDPRPALGERYKGLVDYVGQVTRSAQALSERRLLLDEDVDRYEAAAGRQTGFGR